MALPDTVRVKISTEAAEYVALTAVVARELPVRELVEMMLGVAGKDVERVHELLLRGTLVSGGSRLRWAGWDADRDAIASLLATFPDADPGRAFAAERAVRAVLLGPECRIEITREVGRRRRFLRRRTFWGALIEPALAAEPRYLEYSYKDRADRYSLPLTPEAAARIRRGAALLNYTSLEMQVRRAVFDRLDLYVARES